jgi:hypothetical protein
MPYVIAVNSSDAMLTDRRFKETLYGRQREVTDSRVERGFWGTARSPTRRHVSAALFTQNLWPETLLMGQVPTCLYLNPWAAQPYDGVLTRLPTFRVENGSLREYAGGPLHKLLKLRKRDSASWR